MVANIRELERLALALPAEERRELIQRLAQSLSERSGSSGRDLFGIWRGRFPDSFDVDAALREIRGQWRDDAA